MNDTSTLDYCFSILGQLPDYLDDSAHFILNVQGSISNQLVEPTDYQYENDSNYTYSGRFVGSEGWITVVSNDHSRSATVYYPGYFIEFIPLKADSCICVKHSDSPAGRPACDIEQEVYNENAEVVYGCSSTSCATIIRILLLITPQAEAKLPNREEIKTLAKKWAENINLAFRNSYIPHRVEIELDYYNFTNYHGSGDIRLDVINLRSDQDANNLRESHRADLLFLITDHNYSYLGHVGNEVVDPDRAHGIIDVPYIDEPDFTLAHEAGHLFEAHHQRKVAGNPADPQDCSFAWKTSNDKYTLLNSGLRPYILHYSDPEAKYAQTYTTGNINNNNAGKIRTTGCVVANHQLENKMQLTMRSSSGMCGQYNIQAVVRSPEQGFPGQPPYTYTWEYSKTGNFDDAVFISSSSGINFNVCNVINPGFLFIRVTVESDDHELIQLTRKANCKNCPTQQAQAEERYVAKRNAYASINGMKYYFDAQEEEIIDFSIYALDGKLLSKSRNMQNLPSGFYFVQLVKTSGIIKNYKIFCYEN
ncbi:MAG: zinc-dependent metalloprotease [Saprospiraceae bacterium]|mgnify:FL=1